MPDDGNGSVLVVSVAGHELALGRLCDDDPLVAVEAVARLHLAAERRGVALCVRSTDARFLALLDLVGLAHLVQA